MSSERERKTADKPVLKPGAKGTPITEDDDFGEATFGRAFSAVSKAIADAEKKAGTTPAAKPKIVTKKK